VVEHVVSTCVEDACLEHAVIAPEVTHDLLGAPIGFMARRPARWAGAQKAEQDDLAHSGRQRGGHNIGRAGDVHARPAQCATAVQPGKARISGGTSPRSLVVKLARDEFRINGSQRSTSTSS